MMPSPPAKRSPLIRARALTGACGLILFFSLPLGIAQNSGIPKSGQSETQHSAAATEGLRTNTNRESSGKVGHEKAKTDAEELVVVASDLRDQLHKMDVNVFSLEVQQKTETIEKLVKKIKVEGNER